MKTRYISSSGRHIQVGAKIGTGGEGAVYELVGEPERVVKLYHRVPSPEHARKLKAMASICGAELEKISAWPSETVSDAGSGKLVGVVMKRLARDFREIINLYNPNDRKKYFSFADYGFLVHTAANLAAAFETMHKAGIVVGDVNQKNLLVNQQALIRLIDCDSFQVMKDGELFRCRVGVPEYTPPELHGKNFAMVNRSENHDDFGLAVIMFSLLMMGRHPFAGVSLGTQALDLQQSIQGYHFAYAGWNNNRVLSPPPNAPPIDILSSQLIRLFERAFSQTAAQQSSRPRASEWLNAFEEFKGSMLTCTKNAGHKFGRHRSRCPWCEFESRAIIFFAIQIRSSSGVVQPGKASFGTSNYNVSISQTLVADLSAIIRRYQSLHGNLNPNFPNVSAQPLNEDALAGRRLLWSLRVCLLLMLVIYFGGAGAGFTGWVLGALIIWWIREESDRNEFKNEQACRKFNYDTALSGWQRVQDLSEKFKKDNSNYLASFKHAEKLLTEYQGLPERLTQERAKLEQNKRKVQERVFLQRFTIDAGAIANFGPNRKAVLRSFGIYTAADIDVKVISSIPGIGDSLAQNLIDWQLNLLSSFQFNPNEPIPQSELAALKSKIEARANILETELSHQQKQLAQAVATLEAAEQQLRAMMNQQALQLAQAKADWEASL